MAIALSEGGTNCTEIGLHRLYYLASCASRVSGDGCRWEAFDGLCGNVKAPESNLCDAPCGNLQGTSHQTVQKRRVLDNR